MSRPRARWIFRWCVGYVHGRDESCYLPLGKRRRGARRISRWSEFGKIHLFNIPLSYHLMVSIRRSAVGGTRSGYAGFESQGRRPLYLGVGACPIYADSHAYQIHCDIVHIPTSIAPPHLAFCRHREPPPPPDPSLPNQPLTSANCPGTKTHTCRSRQ